MSVVITKADVGNISRASQFKCGSVNSTRTNTELQTRILRIDQSTKEQNAKTYQRTESFF